MNGETKVPTPNLTHSEGGRLRAISRANGQRKVGTLARTRTLELAASKLNGGREAFVEYARYACADVPEVAPFVSLWDEMSKSDRHVLKLDDIAHLAALRDKTLISAVAGAASELNVDISDMLAAHELPAVVKASIKAAKTARGTKDREMLMQHHQFIPIPRGSTIQIQQNLSTRQSMNAPGLPQFEDTITEVVGVIRDEGEKDDGQQEVKP